ncbi:MAG: hypothetical protein E7E70_28165, partial [Escherichia coli]|nr:hypothetical protein [Escherichia coli]
MEIMEYLIYALIVAGIIYLLTGRKKKKPSPIKPEEKPSPIKPEEKPKEDTTEHTTVKPLPTEEKIYWTKDGKKGWGRIKHMPQGLQVFDENGNCVLDITDRITKYCGSFKVNGTSGSLTNEVLREGELWYVFKDIAEPKDSKPAISNIVYVGPVIEKRGNRLTWTYSNPSDQ